MSDPITRLNAALQGRYRIERELGEGGMATVYLAEDLKHERHVALKVLKPELAAVVGAERFLAEIKTTANLQHPHILALYDSGEADGFLYYVTPYIEGETLGDRLEREKQLPVDEAVRIATDVAEALHAAHEQGVIHRDIKPANILLSRGRPLVADFGIALAISTAGGGRWLRALRDARGRATIRGRKRPSGTRQDPGWRHPGADRRSLHDPAERGRGHPASLGEAAGGSVHRGSGLREGPRRSGVHAWQGGTSRGRTKGRSVEGNRLGRDWTRGRPGRVRRSVDDPLRRAPLCDSFLHRRTRSHQTARPEHLPRRSSPRVYGRRTRRSEPAVDPLPQRRGRRAGVPPAQEDLNRGLTWLARNQDAATGAWPASSLNKERDPASDRGRFMADAATAFAVLALTEAEQPGG